MPIALPIVAAFLLDRRTWLFLCVAFSLFWYIGGIEIVLWMTHGGWEFAVLGLAGVAWFIWKCFKGGRK